MKTYEIKLSDRDTPSTVQALDIGKALTEVVGERLLRAHFRHINDDGHVFNLLVAKGDSTDGIRAVVKVSE